MNNHRTVAVAPINPSPSTKFNAKDSIAPNPKKIPVIIGEPDIPSIFIIKDNNQTFKKLLF